jgi:hypothetical protein
MTRNSFPHLVITDFYPWPKGRWRRSNRLKIYYESAKFSRLEIQIWVSRISVFLKKSGGRQVDISAEKRSHQNAHSLEPVPTFKFQLSWLFQGKKNKLRRSK